MEIDMKTIVTSVVVAGLAALFVSPGEAAQQAEDIRTSQPAPTATSSEDPAAAVKAVQLALSQAGLASKDVSVASHASTVILTGSVSSEEQAAKIRAVAEKAAAGTRVSSRLEVPEAADDAPLSPSVQLVRDVEAALKKDPRTANLGISVSIDEQQTIGLHGLVPSNANSAAAQTVATQTAGVKKVRNYLVTPGSPSKP
jgi:osmotically-inducible protein OsmY